MHQARNLFSFKKHVVAVLTAVILLTSVDQYITMTTTEIKFILPSFVPQRDTAAQPDHVIKTMPEMANLVYNMYMHMIQTSQKNKQVLKMVHHTLKDFCFHQSDTTVIFFLLLITSKSRVWLHRHNKKSLTPRPRRRRLAPRSHRKKLQWSRNRRKKSHSLRAPAR